MSSKNPRQRRVTLTLPTALVVSLDGTAQFLGVSRSALCTQLMGEIVPPLYDLLQTAADELGQGESPGDVRRRLRGASKALVERRVAAALQELQE